MEKRVFDWGEIAKVARKAVAEGCVLLENSNHTLPIKKGEKVAVFGRSMFNYYKSGTGSGGCVNVPYVVGILDAFKKREQEGFLEIDSQILKTYEEWLIDNPFDAGMGWAAEPWNQVEMPLNEDEVKASAKRNDIAVIILGRTAGEDKDNRVAAGSYMLSLAEEKMIETVTRNFSRVAVVLNTGNIIDMKWVETYKPGAVLYAWQGGLVGGDGTVDVLVGAQAPSGCLPDTIAGYMVDYPAASNFGDGEIAVYQEDIYMGYRYFETFAPDKVMYPFGFGLNYSEFTIKCSSADIKDDVFSFSIEVSNIGEYPGEKVVQIYLSKPQGEIGNPAKELVGFEKTTLLKPGEKQTLQARIPVSALKSYDDSGATGYACSYVMLAGNYDFYIGQDSRRNEKVYTYTVDKNTCVEKLTQALAPVTAFERIKPVMNEEGGFTKSYEPTPLRNYSLKERILRKRPADRPCTGDKGIRLVDVYEKRNALEEYLDQLEDIDLIHMSRGEGMCSPKVTPGTASAFGGVTDKLSSMGMPVGCCADGPSGIRMDCGTLAFAMPSGTSMASTFNLKLIEELYELEGMDLRKNEVDLLLGPGINMHRHPLNGRNFEYFSEDPYLTGMMAAAQLKGMHKQGVSGTIKHFVGNEQEFHRYQLNSVVSERALREIYLKPFEIAVKEGGAYSIMTSYGSVNGLWTAGSYDLNTTILRDEWGFTGMVMTDWWAQINEEGEEPSRTNTSPMIRAQNDVYMVVSDSLQNTAHDTAEEGLKEGIITRGELLRNAANVCRVLMKSPCMDRFAYGRTEEWEDQGLPEGILETISYSSEITMDEVGVIDLSEAPTDKGCVNQIDLTFRKRGYFTIEFEMSTDPGLSELAQLPMSVYNGRNLLGTISITPTNGEIITQSVNLTCEVVLSANIKLKFGMSGLHLHKMTVTLDKEFTEK